MVQSLKVVGVHGQIFLRIAYGPLELEQLPPLNLWDSYITSDPLGPHTGKDKGNWAVRAPVLLHWVDLTFILPIPSSYLYQEHSEGHLLGRAYI